MKPQFPAPLLSALPDARAAAIDSRPDRHGERCERLLDRRR
jgi:hypothetical protein